MVTQQVMVMWRLEPQAGPGNGNAGRSRGRAGNGNVGQPGTLFQFQNYGCIPWPVVVCIQDSCCDPTALKLK